LPDHVRIYAKLRVKFKKQNILMDATIQKIVEQLKKIRLDKGLTQAEVAQRAEINANTYAKIERGEQTPPIPMLVRIGDAMGVEVDVNFREKN
jgi:transcriptional regulator with XRE-family HTH domain